jgi:hypothetical protein
VTDDSAQMYQSAVSITDPVERASALSALLDDYQHHIKVIADLRREAIEEALGSGVRPGEVARSLGVSPGRISQMRRTEVVRPLITGWHKEAGAPLAHIAICGSRGPGTSTKHIDASVISLAALLMRQCYELSHGPTGVGAETLTYVADHFHPAGLDAVRGIVGHANVVRDVDYVLVIGGGSGTQSEIDLALNANQKVLAMPVSGGAAARVYMRQLGDPPLRAWLTDADFSALATADASQFTAIAESVIRP